jgi:hypothetical protein
VFGYFVLWLVLWWGLTHRIDRFWVPALPLLALLAGRGGRWSDTRLWRRGLFAMLVIGSAWGWLASAIPVPGRYPRYFVASEQIETDPRRLAPWQAYFRCHPPGGPAPGRPPAPSHNAPNDGAAVAPDVSAAGGRVLMIGEAAVYDARFPILYSTCFDHGRLRAVFLGRTPDEVRAELGRRGVSHVMVNWNEIARYRRTYGFPEFITPALFDRLVEAGVLVPVAGGDDDPIAVYRVP